MFGKVLICLAYQTTSFKLEKIIWRLAEHEGTESRAGAGGWINVIDETLIKALNATAKKTKSNTKPITYSESTPKIMLR